MTDNTLRLYHDLAWLWPLWEVSGRLCRLLCANSAVNRQYARTPVQTLLNMSCGGGKNAYHLKRHFTVTGIDISQPMLDLAIELNPECEFIQEDMRTCELGRLFDCVFVDDGIGYMLTRQDLAALFHTAWRHLSPGGVMIVAPEALKETFKQHVVRVSTANSPRKPANLDITFIEHEDDPDPHDDTCDFTLIYLIREDGQLRIETDHDIGGIFSLEVWREALGAAGFEVHELPNPESRSGNPVFACVKPV